jgi:hypothetical protein
VDDGISTSEEDKPRIRLLRSRHNSSKTQKICFTLRGTISARSKSSTAGFPVKAGSSGKCSGTITLTEGGLSEPSVLGIGGISVRQQFG